MRYKTERKHLFYTSCYIEADKFINKVNEEIANLPPEVLPNPVLVFESDEDEDMGHFVRIYLSYQRPLTEEEALKLQKEREAYNLQKEKEERATLERLLKKYPLT